MSGHGPGEGFHWVRGPYGGPEVWFLSANGEWMWIKPEECFPGHLTVNMMGYGQLPRGYVYLSRIMPD